MAESPCRAQETSTTLLTGNTPMQNQKLKKLYSEFKKKKQQQRQFESSCHPPRPTPTPLLWWPSHRCRQLHRCARTPAGWAGAPGGLPQSLHPGSPVTDVTRMLAPTSLLGQVEIRILPPLTTPGPPRGAHCKWNAAAGQASFPFPEAKDEARRGIDKE